MTRFVCIALVLILAALSLTACGPKENPPTVHVVHNGQLYEVESYPDETTANGLVYRRDELGDSLVEATIIPADVMPSKEGEVNVNAQSVLLYDMENYFIVVIDGEEYIVPWK